MYKFNLDLIDISLDFYFVFNPTKDYASPSILASQAD